MALEGVLGCAAFVGDAFAAVDDTFGSIAMACDDVAEDCEACDCDCDVEVAKVVEVEDDVEVVVVVVDLDVAGCALVCGGGALVLVAVLELIVVTTVPGHRD